MKKYVISVEIKWLQNLEYVRVKELCNKYNFKEIIYFEIETLKSTLLTRKFHFWALNLLNVLVSCEIHKDPYFWYYDYEY